MQLLSRVRARLVPARLNRLIAGRGRSRNAVLAVVVLTLLAGTASAAVLVSELLDTSEADAAECVSERTAATPEEAHALAVELGCEVEILDRRTSWDTYFATPASTTRHVRTASAQQVVDEASGEWVPVSPEIVESETPGLLGVRAGAYDFAFKAGRVAPHAPFATMTDDDGAAVSVALPVSLGPSTVDGPSLSWPVLNDAGGPIAGATVTTSMYTDTSGMVPVLQLDSPEAAEQVKAVAGSAGISFEMSTSPGVEWRPTEAGGFEAVEVATGEVTLVSPAPRHWDSSGSVASEGSTTSVASSPAESSSAPQSKTLGSRSAADSAGAEQTIPADEAKQRLTEPLTADIVEPMETRLVAPNKFRAAASPALLESTEASWPQFIDPPVSNNMVHWTMIQSGWPDLADWDFGKGASTPLGRSEGLGLCDVDDQYGSECNRDNVKRLIWQFNGLGEFNGASDYTDLDGEEIISATFKAAGNWSYDCSDRDVQAFRLPDIDSGTTWRNYHFRFTEDDTRKQQLRRVHHKSGCPETPGYVDFNVTDAARVKADNDQTTMAIGLMAPNEVSMVAWKKYAGETAKMEIVASYRPKIGSAKTGSKGTCQSTENIQWIGKEEEADGVLVRATPSDYDGGTVKVRFGWRTANNGAWDTDIKSASSGSEASFRLPANLAEGYNAWAARAIDVDKSSLESPEVKCVFYVDTIAPNDPTITSEPPSTTTGAVTEYDKGLERGGKGQKGCFRFDRNGSSDVGDIEVYFNNARVTTLAMTADTKVYCLTPTTVGPQTIKAVSIDRANNVSSSTYTFYVAQAREDGIWSFDDESTTQAADKSKYDPAAKEALQAGKLLFNGATKIAGPHAEWGSRANDKALRFDGVDDFAYSEAWRPVVDTTSSFVVSAHVRLADSASATGWYTAISQRGVTATGTGFEAFRLGYRPAASGTTACPTASAAAGALGGCWTFVMGENHAAAVRSPVPVEVGEWVHLVAEYDKGSAVTGDEEARIWACQVGTAARPAAGKPVRSEVDTVPGVKSGGSFVVGRGYPSGNGSNWFKGDIDNVRIFRGDVLAESKVRRMCQGAEAWQDAGLDEDKFLNPTIAE